jgi:hypothetical protein
MLSLSADHVAAFTLWPHGPRETTVVCELLFHPDEQARPSFDPVGRDPPAQGPRPPPAGPMWDAVVVGLGALGSAAAWTLATAGARVLGLGQFELGHHRGASHDHARIIRRSYHTPGYVRPAGLAYQAWEALEREAGERLVVTTGGLDLFPPG